MKIFEDYFSELQAEMVSICLEYLNDCNVELDTVNNIYIHCSYERSIMCNLFFRINGEMTKIHKVSSAIPHKKRPMEAIRHCNDTLKEINTICKQHKRPMPTEIRLVYDVLKNGLETAYKYEPICYVGKEVILAEHIAGEWFEQLRMTENGN